MKKANKDDREIFREQLEAAIERAGGITLLATQLDVGYKTIRRGLTGRKIHSFELIKAKLAKFFQLPPANRKRTNIAKVWQAIRIKPQFRIKEIAAITELSVQQVQVVVRRLYDRGYVTRTMRFGVKQKPCLSSDELLVMVNGLSSPNPPVLSYKNKEVGNE
jgi:hypothetical protein